MTVIELLVVITVLGLLVTLAFSVVSVARYRQRDLACSSNLRAHVMAARHFATDNQGAFPSNNMRTELYPYLGIGRLASRIDTIMTCPAVQAGEATDHYMHATYGMNQYLSNHYEGVVHDWQKIRYYTRIERPSRVFFFMDGPSEGADAVGNPYYTAMVRPGKNFVYPHKSGFGNPGGGLNVAFVDGHVKWLSKEEFLNAENTALSTTRVNNPESRWNPE